MEYWLRTRRPRLGPWHQVVPAEGGQPGLYRSACNRYYRMERAELASLAPEPPTGPYCRACARWSGQRRWWPWARLADTNSAAPADS